jgi:hypothetical protein
MLVEHLASEYRIDIVVDGDLAQCEPPPRPDRTRIIPLAGFDITSAWRRYDRVIYQLGNSEFHGRAIDMLRRVPGEVIAHDVRLTGLYWWRGNFTSAPLVGEELGRMYGNRVPPALHDAPHVTPDDADREDIWMLRDVIEFAPRVWVHSDFARDVVRREAEGYGLTCDVRVLPFGYPAVSAAAPDAAPARLAPPAAAGDWLQGPYVYSLYEEYG